MIDKTSANNGATPLRLMSNYTKTEQKRTASTTQQIRRDSSTGSCHSQKKCRSNMVDWCSDVPATPGPMRRSASSMMQQDLDDTPLMEQHNHNTPISSHPDKKKVKLGWRRRWLKMFKMSAQLIWHDMSPRSRRCWSICGAFFVFHLCVALMDRTFQSYGLVLNNTNMTPPNTVPTTASASTSFAVVINTYKRPEMLRDAIQHYADTCGNKFGVGQVFIVWAEQGVQPPDPDSFFSTPTPLRSANGATSHSSPQNEQWNRSPVIILQTPKDSLNSRFLPIDNLNSEAIFMVDDDVRVDCTSLYNGFMGWKAFPDTMVGYYPRLAKIRNPHDVEQKGQDKDIVYHTWPVVFFRHRFNLVLTKASFLHSKYLKLYSDDSHPQEIKDYIDEHMNCEDVAMSMLIANHTKNNVAAAHPIYIEGSVTDMGLFGGISTGSGHMMTRSTCLSVLTKVYEKHGWEYPLTEDASLKSRSWLRHFPGFWWQIKPGNVFEWPSVGNIFS